ncbi:ISAzo13 family transposase [Corallococcus sp. bb12-1]|uniref:ISAzo13 family transposase n=1 Tax=Corallococcus sp. bb12-1 TaxID=2996784 RepID=UPI00226E72B1|nr:ISAzo13 family transposase [Corallococcus sp. bb12-1]MCY1042366.1 ISAzo13 family transposase [Corallococcus sp. bb12-1]MCY1044580.1 ISAzo13 family transposase [Corallococcus sp. bb12-1]MCY1046885.1 ISAzo13 family transposase [Corallococcus sp. bb12-1]
MDAEKAVAERYQALRDVMDERVTRRWAGAEALALGRGGVTAVARATGLARMTVRAGRDEASGKSPPGELVRVRRKGAGRPPVEVAQPGLTEALESLVDPVTRGDPESPLRWTCKSTRVLAAELKKQGYEVSPQKVGELLKRQGYSLQAGAKSLEGESHSDRNAQFEHINAQVGEFQQRGQPVVSVDTKKKELVGEFKNGGREWQPAGAPVLSLTHDFPDTAVGKAIPYGVYDVGDNSAWVSVGVDHDTPVFAVNSIATWWRKMGQERYPEAQQLLVTADSGGSNSARSRVWKAELQRLADTTGLSISVCHFPPGTSKWNKVEHRLFSHISMNWRGRPLEDYETVVNLIGTTTTAKGLKVNARLDRRRYRTGVSVSQATMHQLRLIRSDFHGDWNYVLKPISAK